MMNNTLLDQIDGALDRLQWWLSHILRCSILIAIVMDVAHREWMLVFISSLALVLTFLPALLERNYKIMLPIEFEFIVVFFIYASMFLGEKFQYYHKFWWWDIFLHALSSITLGFIGFVILYVLYSKKLIQRNRFVVAFFSFCFAVALGALWEVFEFFMDSVFGLNMLKDGLVDTMWDLITNCAGALIVSIAAYFYLKYNEGGFVKDWLLQFIKANPALFQKKS